VRTNRKEPIGTNVHVTQGKYTQQTSKLSIFCGAFLEGNEVAGANERDRVSILGMEMQRAESG